MLDDFKKETGKKKGKRARLKGGSKGTRKQQANQQTKNKKIISHLMRLAEVAYGQAVLDAVQYQF